jgi:hypothetical protein
VQQISTSDGINAMAVLRATSKRHGRADRNAVHGHPRAGQASDRIVGAASVGEDAIVGIRRRFRPTLGMRRFVQGNRIDGNLHGGIPLIV